MRAGSSLAITAPFTITVMVNGEVIASDVPERIRSNRQVQVAYLGEGLEEVQ